MPATALLALLARACAVQSRHAGRPARVFVIDPIYSGPAALAALATDSGSVPCRLVCQGAAVRLECPVRPSPKPPLPSIALA